MKDKIIIITKDEMQELFTYIKTQKDLINELNDGYICQKELIKNYEEIIKIYKVLIILGPIAVGWLCYLLYIYKKSKEES